MAKESLEVISKDAATLYAYHKAHVKMLGSSSLAQSPKLELTDFDREVGLTEPYDHSFDPQRSYDANVRVAADFARYNAEQLHELAIIEDLSQQ